MKARFLVKKELMYNRLLKIDQHMKSSAFLFGPRGTGKTAWIKATFRDGLYFDLLNDDLYTEFLARPTRLSDHIPSDFKDWIILDEVQKIPSILNEVHRLIEGRKLRFLLTGSSARTLKRKGVNLLAGRALTYHMHPLTAEELGKDFDLQRALKFGHLPAVIHHSDPKKYLSSYIKTYLREEVLQEGIVRNISLFTRFLETASFSQGEVINYTEIAREVATNRHVVSDYFQILEDLLIASRLSVFSKRAKRDLITHPKFYYFDVGVFRSIRPRGPLDSEADIDGPALETLFLQEARAINDYYDLGYEFYYWRTRNQIEVDFVLYGERGLLAFEIKRKARLSTQDLNGLKVFSEDYPMAKKYILYGGSTRYIDQDIHVIPVNDAIKELVQLLSVITN
jgi:predicted AAA+ superfamily ATPase